MHTMKLSKALSLPIPELRGSLGAMKYPAFGEIKYDGEFTHIVYDGDKIVTVNKYNKIRSKFPDLMGIHDTLKKTCKSAIMLAELFYDQGKRNDLYGLNSHKESDSLSLYVFDIYELDGQILQDDLIDRKELLHNLLPNTYTTKVLQNKVDAEYFFNNTVLAGYEGVVVKPFIGKLTNGPCNWVKMKMKDQNDYQVSLVDPTLERIEITTPLIGTVDVHGPTTYTGGIKVGVKAPARYKRHINVGDLVTIEHQGVLDSGSLRHPVLIPKKEWK